MSRPGRNRTGLRRGTGSIVARRRAGGRGREGSAQLMAERRRGLRRSTPDSHSRCQPVGPFPDSRVLDGVKPSDTWPESAAHRPAVSMPDTRSTPHNPCCRRRFPRLTWAGAPRRCSDNAPSGHVRRPCRGRHIALRWDLAARDFAGTPRVAVGAPRRRPCGRGRYRVPVNLALLFLIRRKTPASSSCPGVSDPARESSPGSRPRLAVIPAPQRHAGTRRPRLVW